MSEIGARIRRLFDEVASPVDLERIVQHPQSRSPFFWRRAVAYTSVALVLVTLTGFLAYLVRDGGVSTVGSTPPTIAVTTSMVAESSTTSVVNAGSPDVPLVYMSAWPDTAIAPIMNLPICETSDHLSVFVAAEFADADPVGTPIDTFALAAAIPVPRFGANSTFPLSALDGACLESGQFGDVIGWAVVDADGTVVLRAATRQEHVGTVPQEVFSDNYHQTSISSGHHVNVSISPDGRMWGIADHNYFVLDTHPYLPDGDLHVASETLIMSLWKQHTVETDPRWQARPRELFAVTGLPDGYGLCVDGELVWETSGEAEWFRSVFCTAEGEYIEVYSPSGEDLPPVPGDARDVPMFDLTASAWTSDDRANLAVNLLQQEQHRENWLWITAPSSVKDDQLHAVLRSTLILSSAMQNGRKVDEIALDPDADYQTQLQSIAAELSPGSSTRLTVFVDEGTSLASIAMAMSANSVEPLDGPTALIRDELDFIQIVASCGGLYFNAQFEVPDDRSTDWPDEYYDDALGIFWKFTHELGCDPGGDQIPTEVLDYWALDGTLESVSDEPGWLCPIRGPAGYGSDLDASNVPADLKRELPDREPIEVGSGDSGPECQQPHLLVLLDPPDATSAATSAGMTVWPQIARPEDACPPENCTFDGPVVDLTLNGEPARLQRLADTDIYMIWWVDSSGTPMYAESSDVSEDRVLEIIRAIDVDARTHEATVRTEALGGLSVVSDQASVGVWVRELSATATYVIDGVNVGVHVRYDLVFDPIAWFAPSTTLELVTVNDAEALWLPVHGNFLMYTDSPGVRVMIEGPLTVDQAVAIAEQLVPG